MLPLAADENFNSDIIRGTLRRFPDLNLVRVQDAGIRGAHDPEVLEWASDLDRVLLTHDVNTMTAHAYSRVASGLYLPGVFVVPDTLPVAHAIEDLLVLAQCGLPGEFAGQVFYFPL